MGGTFGVAEMNRRKVAWVLAGAVLLAGASVLRAPPKDPMQVPTTADDFNKLIAQLKTEAEAFAKADDDKGPAPSQAVKQVQYSKESAGALGRALQAPPSKSALEDLYVLWQLIEPLKMAGNDTLAALKPVLVNILQARCQYKPLPQWPPKALATLNPSPSLPADQLTKAMEQVYKLREEKAAAEHPVVKHNRAVRALEATVKRLLAMIGDNGADEALLRRLALEEQGQFSTYEDTLAAIKAEAGQMKQERAKKLYEQIKALAFRADTKKAYLDPTRPQYSITGNSGFWSEPAYFAVSALQVVNLLATPAKEPAVPVPDVKKFEEDQRRRREGHY